MHTENLVPFAFGDNLVRLVRDESGNPWFVAKDVAKALDYEWNGMKNLQHVPEEWRGVETVSTPSGTQEMLTLSEPGLYFFLGRSDKPKALPFQKWIAGEVLPSIRKTGRYDCRNPHMAEIEIPLEALRLKPAMRQKVIRDAIRMASLDSGTSADAIGWFRQLCRLVSAATPPPDTAHDKVCAFYQQRCQAAPGVKTRAASLYESFRRWHQGQDGELPSMKVFSQHMQKFARHFRSNGSWFEGIHII